MAGTSEGAKKGWDLRGRGRQKKTGGVGGPLRTREARILKTLRRTPAGRGIVKDIYATHRLGLLGHIRH